MRVRVVCDFVLARARGEFVNVCADVSCKCVFLCARMCERMCVRAREKPHVQPETWCLLGCDHGTDETALVHAAVVREHARRCHLCQLGVLTLSVHVHVYECV